ncbi:sucrose operon repressor (scr operon regulatory protein) [Streptococcus pneumoniae]|nr:sucrose operon repressor (scr operon regulatory protein) [Streptococcus pneumoniae]
MKKNRTETIALIIPSIWHPFFSEFAYHVEKELLKYNYKLFICNADSDSQNEIEYIEMLKQNKVDGIIGITYSLICMRMRLYSEVKDSEKKLRN